MTLSNFGICYEGIQRVYRNAIVRHLRTKLTAEFPSDFLEKLRKPFKEAEWKSIEQSAYAPRVSGQLDAPLNGEFDLLSVNHFFNLFDSFYEILTPIPANADKLGSINDKRKLLEWLRNVKELRDPTAHPSESDLSFEDSFVLLDCARRTLVRIGLSADAQLIRNMMSELSGRPLARSDPLEGNLPPQEAIVVDFIGRDIELKALWEWVNNPVAKRWALSGAGGKGKTAIAYEFALDVKAKAPEPFQAVLWLSAKKRRFDEGVTKLIPSPDFSNFDTALTQVLAQYGWGDEAARSIDGKRGRVLELLVQVPRIGCC